MNETYLKYKKICFILLMHEIKLSILFDLKQKKYAYYNKSFS